jgi:hypothetical protein
LAGRLGGGFGLAAGFSRVGQGRDSLAAAQFPPAPPANDPALGEPRQNSAKVPDDAPHQVWKDGVAMVESENQFSLTRAASSTSGRARNQFPISYYQARGMKIYTTETKQP